LTAIALPVYSSALLLAMLLTLAQVFIVFIRIKAPGAKAFSLGNLAAFFYALGSLFEINSTTPDQVLASLTVEYLGIANIGPLLFLTTLSTTRGAWVFSRRQVVLLFVVPAGTILCVATNSFHHLFYTSLVLERHGPFAVPLLGKGPFYILNFIYMNLFLLLGTAIAFRAGLQAPRAQGNPLILLFIGFLFPWAGMAVYQLGWSPWGLDVAPFGLTLAGICFSVAFFRFRLFDLMPLVLDQVFENMNEGVMVIDQRERIIGFNPAFTAIYPQVTGNAVGKTLAALGLEELASGADLRLSGEKVSLTYQVDRSPLLDRKTRRQGVIFMLTDISQRTELSEKLARLARTDELTSLPNRRAMIERLDSETDRLGRYGGTLSLAIADLDHFKQVNDSFGHDAGDATLVHVAQIWSAGLRTSDLLARYGGEEFVIVMPATDSGEAKVLLERLRAKLQSAPVVVGNRQFSVTASFGLISVSENLPGSEMIRLADAALYRAKQSGRNQVHE